MVCFFKLFVELTDVFSNLSEVSLKRSPFLLLSKTAAKPDFCIGSSGKLSQYVLSQTHTIEYEYKN